MVGIGETHGDSGSDRPGFKSSLSLDFCPQKQTLRSMCKYSIQEVKESRGRETGERRQPREGELPSK